MKCFRKVLIVLLSVVLAFTTAGCWNYKEVDDMAIVAGVAIDKNEEDGKLLLSVEYVDTRGGLQNTQEKSKIISLAGDTMFDIVRSLISITGKKLFWSHAKAIIVSEEFAREGLIRVIDWYSRDTETRSDVLIFVSKEKTAREILNQNSVTGSIISFDIAQMMLDEQHISTAPHVQIWDFIHTLETKGVSTVAPLIYIHKKDGKKTVRSSGTAIFQRDKLVGDMTGEETKFIEFARDRVKGGVLPVGEENKTPIYSLEILSNKSKTKPVWVNGKLQMQIKTETHTNLDEVMTSSGFITRQNILEIQRLAEKMIETKILAVVHKAQKKYQSDIFGFGDAIHEDMPKTWNKLKDHWPQEFANMDVVVKSKVFIDSSAKTTRSIMEGD
ncbi:Ger(x)C family spore germination protein [Paenibacillus sp. sgz500958]|uniref:Ger(x)C family spore germination protein n=1 Tax=Paenibacillus sp. sgz500958 TaxID=3242475 RepID=UPI0036D2FB83